MVPPKLMDKKTKNYILLLLSAMFFLGVSATDIYLASLPQMVIDFKSTPSVVNLTLSSYSFGIALAVLFAGELSNRFGRRKCLLFGVAAFSVAAILIALTPWIELIIVLRLIQACGCGAIIIIPRLILKDCMNEREQIHGTGILLMGLIISPALAPLVGAYLAKYFGWRGCFIASGLAGFGLYYLAAKWLPETNLCPIHKFAPVKDYLARYACLLSNRMFWSLTLIYASAVGAYFAFIGISSYLYIDYWHLSPIKYSYIFIYMSIAYLFGNQLMQRLNKMRVATVKIIGIGVYSTLFGALIILFSAGLDKYEWSIFLVTAGVVFMRAANALINPPTQTRIMNYFHQNSAQALGLHMCIGFMANSLAIYLVTLFPLHPFWSLVIVTAVFIVICVAVYRTNWQKLRNS